MSSHKPFTSELEIRELSPGEEPQASSLILKEFRNSVADDLSEEGINLFVSVSTPESLAERASAEGSLLLGGYICGVLVGVLVIRDGNHINLFFVDRDHQRNGIGKALLKQAIVQLKQRYKTISELWVNSSRNAVPAYESMGFCRRGVETEADGIISTPMSKHI